MLIENFSKAIADSRNSCSWFGLYYGNVEHLLTKISDPKIYVEIGMAYGWHMESMAKKFPEVSCIGVDPYIPYDRSDAFCDFVCTIEPSVSDVENFNYFCEAVNLTLKQYPNFKHIRKNSVDALEDFDDNSIDLLFIDGDHRYECVKNECEKWWSKIKSGGIMCGDDYNQSDVKRAVDEFSADKDLRFVNKTNKDYYTWCIRKG
jgi:hypothetical protein